MTFANHTSEFLFSIRGIAASIACAICCLLYNYCSNSTCLKNRENESKGKNKRSIDNLKEETTSLVELKKRNVKTDEHSSPCNNQYTADGIISFQKIEAGWNEGWETKKEIFSVTSGVLNVEKEDALIKEKNIHIVNDLDNCVTENKKIKFSDTEETKNIESDALHSEYKENARDDKIKKIKKNMLKRRCLVDFYLKKEASCINEYGSSNVEQNDESIVNAALMFNSSTCEISDNKKTGQSEYEKDCSLSLDDQLTDNHRYLSDTSAQSIMSLKKNEKTINIKKNYDNAFLYANGKSHLKQKNNFSYIPKNVKSFSKKTNYYKEYNSPSVESNRILKKTDGQKYATETSIMRFSKILRSYSSCTAESQKYVNIQITSEEELSSGSKSSNYTKSAYTIDSTYNNCFSSHAKCGKGKFDTKTYDVIPYDEKYIHSQHFLKKNKICKSDNDICNCERIAIKEDDSDPYFLIKNNKIYYKKSHTRNSWNSNYNEIKKKKLLKNNKNIKKNMFLNYMSEDSSFNKQLPINKRVLKQKSASGICILKYAYENLISCNRSKTEYSEDINGSSDFQNNNFEQNVESKYKTFFKKIKHQKSEDKIKFSLHATHHNCSVYNKKSVNKYTKKKISKRSFPSASLIRKNSQSESKIKKSINKRNIINIKKNENKKMNSYHKSNNAVDSWKCFRNEDFKICKDKLSHENIEEGNKEKMLDSKDCIIPQKKNECINNLEISNFYNSKDVTHQKSINTQNAEYNYVKCSLTDDVIKAKCCHKDVNADFGHIETNKSIICSTENNSPSKNHHQKQYEIDMYEDNIEKESSKEPKNNHCDINFPVYSRIPIRSANTAEDIYCNNKCNNNSGSSGSSNGSRSCTTYNNVNKKKKKQNLHDWDETTSANVNINKTEGCNSNEINRSYKKDKYKNVKEQIFEYLQNSINTYNLGRENKIKNLIKKEKEDNTSDDDVLIKDMQFDCQKNVNIIGFLKKKLIENNESDTENATNAQNESENEQGRKQKEIEKDTQKENDEQKKINKNNKCGKKRKTKNQRDGNTPNKRRERLLKNKNDINKNSKKNKLKIEKLIEANKHTETSKDKIESAELKNTSNNTLKVNDMINSEKEKETEKGKNMGKGKSKNKEKCKDENIEKKVRKDNEEKSESDSDREKEHKIRIEEEKEKSNNAKERKYKRKIENAGKKESFYFVEKKSKGYSTNKDNFISSTPITNSLSKAKEKSIRKTKKMLITEDISEYKKNENILSLNDKEQLKTFCKKYKDIGTNRCASGLTKFIFSNILEQKEESFEHFLAFVLQLQKIFRMSTPDYVELLLFLEKNLEMIKKYSVKEWLLITMHFLKGESTDKNINALVELLKLDNCIVEEITACFFRSKKQITTTEVEVDRILTILSSVVIRRSSRIKQVFNTIDSNSNANTKTEEKKNQEKDKEEEALGSCWDPIYI